ncbi:MAG: cysteine desulfurase NifS [Candidatus Hydrothermarchaeota archaeon]
MKKVYMDYAASSPTDPRVIEAMIPYYIEKYGNPSSIYSFAHEDKLAVEESRKKVAELIGARDDEIIFTSGATESINLALKGVAYRNKEKGNHIITSKIEHISVLNTCKYLQREGFKVSYIPVDEYGTVDVEKLKEEISDKTILISIMYANNEIGTIQPIREIGEIASDKGIYFHVDSVSSLGKVPIDVVRENIDLLSMSSNDIYGPKGKGALYIKKGTKIVPILHGGGQEHGLRSGTEDVPGIVGMGKAAEIMKEEMEEESKRLKKLRDMIIKGATESIDHCYLNGHPTNRLPNNVNLRFNYIEGESLILSLDMYGIYASTGSACTSKTLEPSHVLIGIGLSHELAHGSLQLTLGKSNDEGDVKYFLEVLPEVVSKLRELSPLTPR